jgi:hypothetical protein
MKREFIPYKVGNTYLILLSNPRYHMEDTVSIPKTTDIVYSAKGVADLAYDKDTPQAYLNGICSKIPFVGL